MPSLNRWCDSPQRRCTLAGLASRREGGGVLEVFVLARITQVWAGVDSPDLHGYEGKEMGIMEKGD